MCDLGVQKFTSSSSNKQPSMKDSLRPKCRSLAELEPIVYRQHQRKFPSNLRAKQAEFQ